jgi:peroxiredoxin
MNVKQLTQLAFIALAALGVYMFVTSAQDGEARASCSALCALKPNYANEDRRVPEFTLPDLNGKRVSMSSLRGKTVVLNFWTKTCRPCLEEMPSIAELANIWKDDKDKVVLTISTDVSADDARATLKAVLGREPPFGVLIDPESEVVGDKFGTKLFPETWVIDPNGVIRARFDGPRDWSSPVVQGVVNMAASAGVSCPVTFRAGKPEGALRGVCETAGL